MCIKGCVGVAAMLVGAKEQVKRLLASNMQVGGRVRVYSGVCGLR